MYRCRVYSINGKTGKEIDIGSKQYKHILREKQRQRERERIARLHTKVLEKMVLS